MHEATDCDLIVCWSHNWLDCPIEVLGLKSLVGKDWGWAWNRKLFCRSEPLKHGGKVEVEKKTFAADLR
jgi:hypothetical protein